MIGKAPYRLLLSLLIVIDVLMPAWGHADPTPEPSAIEGFDSAVPEDVSRLLRATRQRYGEDAVAIETNLLVNAMRNGSLLATAVRVDGIREYQGKRYLGFQVETGMIFDDRTRGQTDRLQILWASIMEPVLARLTDGLQLPADGMSVALQYHHRSYASVAELRASIDQPGPSEEATFHVLASDVDDLVRRRLTTRTLIERTRITVNGQERSVPPVAHDPLGAPGPP